MVMIKIHSHLKHFQLLERIVDVTPKSMGATCCLEKAPTCLILEAMGQLATLHVRHLVAFKRHAFLLKVTHFDIPALELAAGRYMLTADQVSQSSNAFFYQVVSRGPHNENFETELLIGTQAYDGRFQETHLKDHYEKRFNRMKYT